MSVTCFKWMAPRTTNGSVDSARPLLCNSVGHNAARVASRWVGSVNSTHQRWCRTIKAQSLTGFVADCQGTLLGHRSTSTHCKELCSGRIAATRKELAVPQYSPD
jgi:hypothetical protein